MKRSIVLIILLAIVSSLCFAGGSSEKTKLSTTTDNGVRAGMDITQQAKGETEYYEDTTLNLILNGPDGDAGVMGNFMWTLSNILDNVTKGVCISLTPYPKAMELFYPSLFKSRHIDEKYANYGTQLNEIFMNRSGSVTDSISAKNDYKVEIKSEESQKATTNMLMIIIMSLFLAEILFTIIYGYVTGGEEPMLKTLLVKGVTCLLIGALVMSLPFIIEAFKWGFDKAVKIISGAQLVSDSDEQPGTTLSYMYMAAVESSPFDYPGLMLRLVTAECVRLDPENAGIMNLFGDEGIIAPVSKVMVNVLFFIVQVIIFFVAIIASLHIMFNVIEVYILMSLALILLPFQVFRLTSFMGSGVFRSLISNVIQLAVIIFIMVSVVPLTSSISTNIWSNIAVVESNDLEAAWEFTSLSDDKSGHKTSIWELLVALGLINNDGTVSSELNGVELSQKITMDENRDNPQAEYTLGEILQLVGFRIKMTYILSEERSSQSDIEVPKKTNGIVSVGWLPTEIVDIPSFGKLYGSEITKKIDKAISDRMIALMQEAVKKANINMHISAGTPFENISKAKKQEIAKSCISNISLNPKLPLNTNYKKTAVEDGHSAWTLVFIYLATALCLAYIECFFIFRSSQITEGLLNGRDSGPDFGRILAARGGGAIARATGKAAMTPVRGVAAVGTAAARLGVANIGQTAADRGHTFLGGMLKTMSNSGSTREYSAGIISNDNMTGQNTANRDSKNG